MIRSFGEILERAFGSQAGAGGHDREHALNLATAVLLIEVARADFDEDVIEDRAIAELLKAHFSLADDEIEMLVDEARSEADHAASLQAFTRELHEALSTDEKLKIVEMLWRVALADQVLDKHEDHLVRKIAGLLYVSHGDLIRLRNMVAD